MIHNTKRSPAGLIWPVILLTVLLSAACGGNAGAPGEQEPAPSTQPPSEKQREDYLPSDVSKGTPEGDAFPPVVQCEGWEQPVPLPGEVNTLGAEDSPFITPDGKTLYFFFTPDVRRPAEEQLVDGVTGLWVSDCVDGQWRKARRVVLHDDVSLDGAQVVRDGVMWFASVRRGNLGEIDWYIAHWRQGAWRDWENAGPEINEVLTPGELHLSADGTTMFFGSDREGGFGGRDIWYAERDGDQWGQPINLGSAINTEGFEDQPFITPDGREMWFTGSSRLGRPGPAVFRSVRREDGSWGPAEEVISSFAGEPTLDAEGNIYFVHHFFTPDMEMVEADIYVAYRK